MVSINAIGSDDPIEVAKGGTGVATTTAFAVQCAGTTATGPFQSIAALGASGTVLTSTGAGSLPTMQAPAGGGGEGMKFLTSVTASNDATIVFTSDIDATYNSYVFVLEEILPITDNAFLWFRVSTDGGTGYDAGVSDYTTGGVQQEFSTAPAAHAITAGPEIKITHTTVGISNVSNEGLSGRLYLYSAADVTKKKVEYQVCYQQPTINRSAYVNGFGLRLLAQDVDAVQFLMSTGNIASGTIKLYGMTTPA